MGFLQRSPFALLGAIGLLSLAQDLLQWHEWIGAWLDAWQAVSRPVIGFLFGWIPDLFGWPFPWWAKDYLAVGIIHSGMNFRMSSLIPDNIGRTLSPFFHFGPKQIQSNPIFYRSIFMFYDFLVWPVVFVSQCLTFFSGRYRYSYRTKNILNADIIEARKNQYSTYFETLIYAFIITGINYVLIFDVVGGAIDTQTVS